MIVVMRRVALALMLIPAAVICAQELKPVTLPAPQTTGGKPLMEALKARQSTRSYDARKLPQQVLSNLLWAAWGINRPDGRRTAPSASNRQEITVYVITAEGAYTYDASANALNPVAAGDLRGLTGGQTFVTEAPVNLVYVADFSKFKDSDENSRNATSHADAGLIAENVYLFCASEGLGSVVRGSVTREALGKALNLRPDQRIILAHTVGYPKN